MSVLSAIRQTVSVIFGTDRQTEAFAARIAAVSKRDNEVWAEYEKWLRVSPTNDAEHEQKRLAGEAWIHQLRYGYGPPMFSDGAKL